MSSLAVGSVWVERCETLVSPPGASLGFGGRRRRGERHRVSVRPPPGLGAHSCRYWRSVLLTPALPFTSFSFFLPAIYRTPPWLFSLLKTRWLFFHSTARKYGQRSSLAQSLPILFKDTPRDEVSSLDETKDRPLEYCTNPFALNHSTISSETSLRTSLFTPPPPPPIFWNHQRL